VCDLLPRVIEAATGLGAERLECQRDGRPACVFTGGWRPPRRMRPVKPASPSTRPDVPRPGGIAAVFLLAAVPYLLFLDWLLLGAAPDAESLMASQALKGWASCWSRAAHVPAGAPAGAPTPDRPGGPASGVRRHDRGLGAGARPPRPRDRGARPAGGGPRRGWASGSGWSARSSRRCGTGRCCTTSARSACATRCCAGAVRSTTRSGPRCGGTPSRATSCWPTSSSCGWRRSVVRSHHERWDGGGYPDGLTGEAIPKLARVFAVVDVYDALMSDRPYRPAWPEARVLAHLRRESGRQFDPRRGEGLPRPARGRRADPCPPPGSRPRSAAAYGGPAPAGGSARPSPGLTRRPNHESPVTTGPRDRTRRGVRLHGMRRARCIPFGCRRLGVAPRRAHPGAVDRVSRVLWPGEPVRSTLLG
jgi:hypothetical protein